MLLFFVSLCSLSYLAASDPTPCVAPPGVVPIVSEALCYKTIVPKSPSGIEVRSYVANPNATFASGSGNGAFPNGLQAGIANVLSYFTGSNDESRTFLQARTVPFAITRHCATCWVANMEVSPTQFPDDFLIPRPIQGRGVSLSHVNDNIGGNVLIAVFQFNTTGFPYLENIEEACGVIQNSTLPSGYAVNTTHPWSPTYAFYNGQNDVNYTSECWMAAYAL